MKHLLAFVFVAISLNLSAQTSTTIEEINNTDHTYLVLSVVTGSGGNNVVGISVNIDDSGKFLAFKSENKLRTPQQVLNFMHKNGWEYIDSWDTNGKGRKILFRRIGD